MDPVDAACHRDFAAAHDSGTRPVTSIIWVVMHSTEGATAAGAAAWFANPQSQGSAHLVVDDAICYRTLDNDVIPWAAPGANEQGFHIEQAGFARWSAVLWRSHYKTLQRAAYKCALHCNLFGIPAKFITADGLKTNMEGITTHAEVTKAFGGTHTDPGPLWPRWLFMRLVRGYLTRLRV